MAEMIVPFQFDPSTRRTGPQWNYFGGGPGVVATSHGSAPDWTSRVFENQIGGQPQEVELVLHSLDPTLVVPGQEAEAPHYNVQIFLVPNSVTSSAGIAPYEIYNVTLISTESLILPAHIIVNPSYEILLLTSAANTYGLTWVLNIHTVV